MSGYHKQTLSAVALILSLVVITPLAVAQCEAGDLHLELVSATGDDAASHPLAKCFSSMTVSVLSDCTLTLVANGENSFVPALWSAAATYNQVKHCPTGVSLDFADQAAATATTGLASIVATSIYAEGMTASVTAVSGEVTITSTYLGNPATLKFRSSDTTGSAVGIFATVGAPSCATDIECASAASGCQAGRHPVLIQGQTTYVCALCASGSYSGASATSCTKCAAGSALAGVGASSNTCSPCNEGTFATLGSSDCRPCAPGMYQDVASSSSCKSCPTTWSSHTYGATECVKCTIGRPSFCSADCSDSTAGSGGAFTATVANDATWTTAAGFPVGYSYPALLNPCSPASTIVSFTVDATCAMEVRALANPTETDGLMCSDPSNTASDVVAYYTGATTIMSRLSADKGSVLKIGNVNGTTVTMSATAATSLPIAPSGTITGDLTVNGGALAGASTTTCPGGTTATTGASRTLRCTPCPPGSSCLDPKKRPATCEGGTYSTLGQATCTACPSNTYAPDKGSSECLACSGSVGNSGTTCDGSTSDCGVGKELNPATNVCECAPGYGGADCTICPVNTYSAGGDADCTPCPQDTFSAEGSESCGVCPAGEAKNGSGVCARCLAGEEPNSGALACIACSSGFYNPDGSNGAQFDKCQRCDGGKFVNGGKTSCSACSAGFYSTWTSSTVRVPDDATTCSTCPDGGYSAAGASRCTPCSGGAQKNGAGDGCTKCDAGSARAPYTTGGCNGCPAGTFAGAGGSACINCSPGEYSGANAGTCTKCAVDTYSTDPGATTCVACKPGFTTLGETGATFCSACPVGSAYDSNSQTCVECEKGYYQNREGQSRCKKCPIGRFSDEEGSETCEACAAGKYNSVSGSSRCRVCPGGTFSAAGKGSCSICAKGKFSAPGSTACTTCDAGYYASKLGSRTCTACPAGSKCPDRGSTRPTLCDAGSYQSKPAQTKCIPCKKKTAAPKAGARKCQKCSTATTDGTATCPSSRRRMLFNGLVADTFQ